MVFKADKRFQRAFQLCLPSLSGVTQPAAHRLLNYLHKIGFEGRIKNKKRKKLKFECIKNLIEERNGNKSSRRSTLASADLQGITGEFWKSCWFLFPPLSFSLSPIPVPPFKNQATPLILHFQCLLQCSALLAGEERDVNW